MKNFCCSHVPLIGWYFNSTFLSFVEFWLIYNLLLHCNCIVNDKKIHRDWTGRFILAINHTQHPSRAIIILITEKTVCGTVALEQITIHYRTQYMVQASNRLLRLHVFLPTKQLHLQAVMYRIWCPKQSIFVQLMLGIKITQIYNIHTPTHLYDTYNYNYYFIILQLFSLIDTHTSRNNT